MLQVLGSVLAHDHRYREASKLFQDAIEKASDSQTQSIEWYMYATVAAVAGHPEDAIQYLQNAIKLGYKSANGILADETLKTLHTNPKFQQLVAEIKKPLAVNPLQSSDPSKVSSPLREREVDSQGKNSPTVGAQR